MLNLLFQYLVGIDLNFVITEFNVQVLNLLLNSLSDYHVQYPYMKFTVQVLNLRLNSKSKLNAGGCQPAFRWVYS